MSQKSQSGVLFTCPTVMNLSLSLSLSLCVCAYTCVRTCVCTYVCVYACVCLSVSVCMNAQGQSQLSLNRCHPPMCVKQSFSLLALSK